MAWDSKRLEALLLSDTARAKFSGQRWADEVPRLVREAQAPGAFGDPNWLVRASFLLPKVTVRWDVDRAAVAKGHGRAPDRPFEDVLMEEDGQRSQLREPWKSPPCSTPLAATHLGWGRRPPPPTPSVTAPATGIHGQGRSLLLRASVPAVFGELESHVVQLWSEGRVAHRLSTGEWVGNVIELERARSYWLVMDLSGGGFWDPPGKPPVAAVPLDGEPNAPDLRYQVHAGTNMMSFAGDTTVQVPDGLSDTDEPFFEQLVGGGTAAFQKEPGWWTGSLVLGPNRGYEVLVTADIPGFQWDLGGLGESYAYGCTHPIATNFDPSADVDDTSCVFDVPAGWDNPTWVKSGTTYRPQAFVVFQGVTVAGGPLEPSDAIGAFVAGTNVGFGFPVAGYTTAPAMNVPDGTELAFEIYDASEGMTTALDTDTPVVWKNHAVIVVGCQDDVAANYLPDATVGYGNCEP